MKNNILLISVVAFISIVVITVVIVLSASDKDKKDSDSRSSHSSQSTYSEFVPEPTEESSEPVTESTTHQTTPAAPETNEPTQETLPASPEAEGIIATAKSLIGVPFADDGDTPDGFDNSGFIYYVLRENGYITCPRGVTKQAAMGTAVSFDELKEGDLVFFYNEDNSGAGFGGIYIGNNKMIACLMPGTFVKEVDISTDYYRNSFYRGVSLS